MGSVHVVTEAHKAFFTASVYGKVESLARKAFRWEKCPGRRDDSIAMAHHNAWVYFVRLVKAGREGEKTPWQIALRGVNVARRGYAPGTNGRNGRRIAQEPLDWKIQRRHGFGVAHVGSEAGGVWQDAFRETRRASILEQVAFRMDFARFVENQSPEEREEIAELAAGNNPYQTALKLKRAPATIGRHQLRWRTEWDRFVSK